MDRMDDEVSTDSHTKVMHSVVSLAGSGSGGTVDISGEDLQTPFHADMVNVPAQ